MELFDKFCQNADEWLKEDPKNVIFFSIYSLIQKKKKTTQFFNKDYCYSL